MEDLKGFTDWKLAELAFHRKSLASATGMPWWGWLLLCAYLVSGIALISKHPPPNNRISLIVTLFTVGLFALWMMLCHYAEQAQRRKLEACPYFGEIMSRFPSADLTYIGSIRTYRNVSHPWRSRQEAEFTITIASSPLKGTVKGFWLDEERRSVFEGAVSEEICSKLQTLLTEAGENPSSYWSAITPEDFSGSALWAFTVISRGQSAMSPLYFSKLPLKNNNPPAGEISGHAVQLLYRAFHSVAPKELVDRAGALEG